MSLLTYWRCGCTSQPRGLCADWVKPHKKLFIRGLADSGRWEIRLQIVRALPLLDWTPRERKRVIQILRQNVEHPQKFVRAWALDALATFAEHDRGLVPIVTCALEDFERSGSKALQTRARHIRTRLRAALEMQGSAPNCRSRRGSHPPVWPKGDDTSDAPSATARSCRSLPSPTPSHERSGVQQFWRASARRSSPAAPDSRISGSWERIARARLERGIFQ